MKGANVIFIVMVVLVTSLTYFVGTTITGTVTGKATAVPAISQDKTTFTSEYILRPSFRQSVNINFASFYEGIEKKANETRDSIIACLGQGSNRNDDNDDLATCAAINPNKDIIQSVKSLDTEFYVVFDMKQGSADTRFAMHLQDNIAPPPTENMRIVEDGGKAYLVWDRNKASDVAYYDVYYMAKGAAYLSLSDLVKYKSDNPVERAEITSLDYKNLDFLVVAKDKAGNIGFKKII